MSVVTRFPPSPTGFMHIGNARTALYNYLFARHHGGKFVVRIEDTDRARHSEEAVQAIFRSLEWLGLEYDNEAVSQFEQRARHAEVAMQMVEKGQAYYCYCSPEELNVMREQAKKEGRSSFYDRRWRDRDPSEAPKGVKPVVRIKAPAEAGESVINDLVQGEIRITNDNLDDFIILRSDGTPTYMLSVVVDDHDMGITHIIRGDDHINNAFRQKIIFEAMGWDIPRFAHLPLIHGADGAKFSKRHGAASVEEYRDMGFLPEALENYLLRLGWGHGDDEIISREQAIQWFDLDAVGKSAAKFDMAKLESLNNYYLSHAEESRLLTLITPFLKQRHQIDIRNDALAQKRVMSGMTELKERSKTLIQLTDEAAFYTKKIPYDFDEAAQRTLNETAHDTFDALLARFRECSDFTTAGIQNLCKQIADDLHGGKLGKVAMPLRAALTGTTVSPSIFHAAEILGQEESVARLEFTKERFWKNNPLSRNAAN
ncbi:MAG: glutamate--tRNA ligase [Alphaproteobacteria bacterium CG_4_9_14_3_um_filter_47_13]|nr:MAG: glutamate--tRNA ligase [Alphaproteobacteria bacterium CG_4_9_14_3_um_filter_47_13]